MCFYLIHSFIVLLCPYIYCVVFAYTCFYINASIYGHFIGLCFFVIVKHCVTMCLKGAMQIKFNIIVVITNLPNFCQREFNQKWKFRHYVLTLTPLEGPLKFFTPQNTAGVSPKKNMLK